jgi:NAD+ kinase
MRAGGAAPRIGVVAHPDYATFQEALVRLEAFAARQGLELFYEDSLLSLVPGRALLTPEVCTELDLLLTLGGDGTLLRGARLVALDSVPVLGVNLGHVGFLTSASPEELETALGRWLAGETTVEERMGLAVYAESAAGEPGRGYVALNDAVLHKGGAARVIR